MTGRRRPPRAGPSRTARYAAVVLLAAALASEPVRLQRRSIPEQLRYLAGKLRDQAGMGVTAESASLLLDAIADELEAVPAEAAAAERERIRQGIRELMQRRPPLQYFGRDLDEVLDGPP